MKNHFKLAHFRPSTLMRVAEDGVIAGAKGVARSASSVAQRAKGVVHSTKLEYRARQQAAYMAAAHEAVAEFAAMSSEQREQLRRDEAAINARAAELLRIRQGTRYYGPRLEA